MIDLQQAWKRSFTEKTYRAGLHLLFWAVYFVLLTGFGAVISSVTSHYVGDLLSHLLLSLLFNIPIICISYYLTIGTFYQILVERKRYLLALLCLIGCIIVFSQLLYLGAWGRITVGKIFDLPAAGSTQPFEMAVEKNGYKIFTMPLAWIQITISYFVLLGVPVVSRVLRDQMRLQQRKNFLEKENIKLEMNFLKAQVHPHFLFNTLNNIYSLITHNESKKSAEMVSGLSSLLRYALYEGKSEFITIEKEVGMLKDYIELEEVRSDDIHLEIQLPTALPDLKIPPFLLLPLVENAFKHGVNSQLKQSSLQIILELTTTDLSLKVKNTFDVDYRKKNGGGLGLFNLKKRLDYYYKNKYYLETKEKDNTFTSTLKLPLLCPLSNA